MSADMYHIGATGSRYGATLEQLDDTYGLLRAWTIFHRQTGVIVALHEGDCLGFDAEVAEMGRDLGCYVIAHPPTSDRFRAYAHADEVRPPKGYHQRDRDIVTECVEIIAAPRTKDQPAKGSGTWYTVAYADAMGVAVHVVPLAWARELGRLPVRVRL